MLSADHTSKEKERQTSKKPYCFPRKSQLRWFFLGKQ